jgi:hypothetical protein
MATSVCSAIPSQEGADQRRACRRLLTRLLACCAFGAEAGAPRALAQVISVSPDTSIELDDTLVEDEDVAIDAWVGVTATQDLGAIPGEASVIAYHLESSGGRLFVLDTTVELPGGLMAEPRDVIRYDGASYALEFDGSGTLGDTDFDDEDVLYFRPLFGSWSMLYDASTKHAEWTPWDVDAVHYVPEPSEPWMLAAGTACLVAITRRRARRNSSSGRLGAAGRSDCWRLP